MTELNTSRRTLVKGAAWAVPVVTVAAAAPALAASPCATTYQSITKTFEYTDTLNNIVTVKVTANNVPMTVNPGDTLTPIETSSVVTISEASAGLLKSFILGNPAYIDGTSNSTSVLSGAFSDETTTALTIPLTPVPPSGPIVTNASGTGLASTVPAGASAGLVTITMGEPTSHLVGYDADKLANGKTFDSTLKKISGKDYILGTFTVCG